jgi:hypothetical protein
LLSVISFNWSQCLPALFTLAVAEFDSFGASTLFPSLVIISVVEVS